MAETTIPPEFTETVANAACELVAESRAALKLAKGAKLSDAIAAVVKFRREYRELDTALDGPYDDASYRAIGEALGTRRCPPLSRPPRRRALNSKNH